GIADLGAAKETNIYVSGKGVDLAEPGVAYARRGMAVMQQLTDIVAAATHHVEPSPRDRPKFTWTGLEPCLYLRISLDSRGKCQKLANVTFHSSSSSAPTKHSPHRRE